MLWTNLDVRSEVEATLLDYGRDILVNKLAAVAGGTLYEDGPLTFATGVAVKAHVAYGRFDEKVFSQQFDESLVYDGTVLFSSSLLLAALYTPPPPPTPPTPIPAPPDVRSLLTIHDRLTFDGKTWRIVAVHYTGELRGEKMVVTVLFKGLEGDD